MGSQGKRRSSSGGGSAAAASGGRRSRAGSISGSAQIEDLDDELLLAVGAMLGCCLEAARARARAPPDRRATADAISSCCSALTTPAFAAAPRPSATQKHLLTPL